MHKDLVFYSEKIRGAGIDSKKIGSESRSTLNLRLEPDSLKIMVSNFLTSPLNDFSEFDFSLSPEKREPPSRHRGDKSIFLLIQNHH